MTKEQESPTLNIFTHDQSIEESIDMSKIDQEEALKS
jgi:hypothetical protein